MPIAIALSAPTTRIGTLRMRAIGNPSRIVKPAIAPRSTVQPKLSGPRCALPKLGSIPRIARFIAAASFGAPS